MYYENCECNNNKIDVAFIIYYTLLILYIFFLYDFCIACTRLVVTYFRKNSQIMSVTVARTPVSHRSKLLIGVPNHQLHDR